MTTRRRSALGALAAGVLLLSAAACSSDSGSTAETLPGAAVDDTAGSTDAPTAQSDATTTPSAAPSVTSSDSDPVDEPAATDSAVEVPQALQFTAPLVGGGTFDGAAYTGKPTVFWFWAPT